MTQDVKVGDRFKTNQYGDIEVVEYINFKNIVVRFDDGYTKRVNKDQVLKGQIRNPYFPVYFGKGFVGEGPYGYRKGREFSLWSGMWQRCYNPEKQVVSKSYVGKEICEEWYNLQNFGQWCQSQIGFKTKGWHLDKDVLSKGNKVYGPTTCCFIPPEINNLFTSNKARRGGLPLGVMRTSDGRYYESRLKMNGKTKVVGLFKDSIEEAFAAYKKAKEDYIKSVADKYKNEIDPRVYTAMYSWVIEETD